MKTTIFAALAAVLALCSAASASTPAGPGAGQLGLGIELGEQNGVTGAYWLNSSQDIEAGMGAAAGEFAFHAEYGWHAWDILPQPRSGKLGLYGSAGFRVRDDQFGLRPVGGLEYWIARHPIQFYLEAGPIFRLTPNTDVDATVVTGVRFYFKPGR